MSTTVAPPKKKGTLKAKLAEKEAAKAAASAADSAYDSDDVLDPREKARRDKERELQADLNNAADLFGAAALGGRIPRETSSIQIANMCTIIIKQVLLTSSLINLLQPIHGQKTISKIFQNKYMNISLND